jgi:hypothetical protein
MRLYTIRLIATLALAILVAPLAAAAQQATKAYRIGRLQSSSPSDPNPTLEAFREGLRDLGYIEGQNLVIESRYAEGREERLPDLAAELVRLQVEVMIAKGEYLGIYEEKKLTFRQFAPGYLVYSQAHKALRSFGRDQGIIETRRMSIFRDQYLSEITRALAKQYKAQRLEVVDPATVNKELNCLKASLNRAVAWKHLKTNRLGGIKLFKEPPGRLRYLSLEEKDRLLEACTEPLYLRPIIELAIHTDMRRGEILGLSWRDIDGRRRTITLHQTKNNEWRVIPINQTVAAIVKTLPRHLESDALFPGVNGNMVTMAFRRAC